MAGDANDTMAFDAALQLANPEYYKNQSPQESAADEISFIDVVDALKARTERLLHSEAIVGQSRNVTGKAHIHIRELRARFERLRDHIVNCATNADLLLKDKHKTPESRALAKSMKRAGKALKTPSYESVRRTTINRRLPVLWEGLSDALDVVDLATSAIAEQIDPGARLDSLTAEEVEGIYEKTHQTARLAVLLRLGDGLRMACSETRELLVGGFGGPKAQPGPHERRRGRELAAFLLGIAVGMGLNATRGDNNTPEESACDAVNGLKSSLPRADPAARAVVAEIPDGYDGLKTVWKARATDRLVGDAVARGFMVGVRLRFSDRFGPQYPSATQTVTKAGIAVGCLKPSHQS